MSLQGKPELKIALGVMCMIAGFTVFLQYQTLPGTLIGLAIVGIGLYTIFTTI